MLTLKRIKVASNPQLQQQMQQHQIIQQQRVRQALLAQQYSGIQPNMPNGMNQMTPAQFQAMRGAGPMARPVNLPQHLQQQQAQAQQQAQHSMEQQQAQAQAQHQVGSSQHDLHIPAPAI